ncbi:Two-component transcriptional response regulator, LuxR family [hydrothermal vent metagenome]|uniref:Two-component transcriptional response regulator, LuxR family n=1 Tax=hydrothermal vent metagenome TaxID=652676 RepID=A0A3B0W627_9ZZZZ
MIDPTIFIVDDDSAMQKSLSWLMETVGHQAKVFSSALEFLETYDPELPGCMILDVRLPGMSGLQLQQKLKDEKINIPVIIISGHGDVPMAVKAMQQGALTFLEKPFRDQDLLDSIQNALEKDVENRENLIVTASIQRCVDNLTPREKDIMERMVVGDANKDIAKYYDISVKTVEVHRGRVMEKMQAHSLPGLVKMALRVRAS